MARTQTRKTASPPSRRGEACHAVALGICALVLAAVFAPPGAFGSTVVVPDDYPTIQAGIDSGVDEVLVRPGLYPETILIDREMCAPACSMTLRGLPGASGELPELLGLILDDTHQHSSHSAYLEISDLHFRGPVKNVFHLCDFSGPYHLDFTDCAMDSGVTDWPQSVGGQVLWSIERCRIAGGVSLRWPYGITFSSNVIRGPVWLAAQSYGPTIEGNLVEGPGHCGITAGSVDDISSVHGNTVRGFDVGMDLPDRGTDIRDNLVEGCPTAGIVIGYAGGWWHHVIGNVVRSCGSAIRLDAETFYLAGNVAEDCGSGISASVDYYAEVRGNRLTRCGAGLTVAETDLYIPNYSAVVSRGNVIESCGGGLMLSSHGPCTADRDTVTDCAAGIGLRSTNSSAVVDSAVVLSSGGPGITIEGSSASATRCVVGRSVSDGVRITAASGAVLTRNTSFLNGGSGFVVQASTDTVLANIGFGNTSHGLAVDPGGVAALSCNDWFSNTAGAVDGTNVGATDLAVDPLFCDLANNDVRLRSDSPLVGGGCDTIGALAVGCGETPTLVQRFTASRVSGGVRVIWQVADGATASAIWVERAEGLNGQAWMQPVMERSIEGTTVVELDRSALPDHAYRYRLVARDGGNLTVLDPGILVAAQATLTFALAPVGPSPGAGPVRVAFTLAHDAPIQIDVFDLLGRKVATPASGVWAAGAQVVNWNGQTREGRPAPAGMYVVRYTFPGGQDRRRFMRVR